MTFIKTNRICRFTDDCPKCTQQNSCLSASRVCYGTRKFILSLRNKPVFTKETKHKFKKGIAKHEEYQKPYKTINEMGFLNFRKRLYQHKKIAINELSCCCKRHGLHGIVDLVHIQWDNDKVLNIWVEELKSGRITGAHFIQLGVYVMILADIEARLIHEQPMVRKNRMKKKLGLFLPNEVKHLNLQGRVFSLSSKHVQPYIEMISHNFYLETMGGIKASIQRKLREFRDIMKYRAVDLTVIPYCRNCSKDVRAKSCGWRDLCSRYPYNEKARQMYMSKHKIKNHKEQFLIKTKPRMV